MIINIMMIINDDDHKILTQIRSDASAKTDFVSLTKRISIYQKDKKVSSLDQLS